MLHHPTTPPTARLRALTGARVAGVVAFSVIAQIAVDMPAGHFGAADEITRTGVGYSVFVLAAGLYFLLALRRGGWRRGERAVLPVLLSVNVGIFVPALPSDPVVAGIVVSWNLFLLAELFFPPSPYQVADPSASDDEVQRWIHRYGPALRHLATMGLGLTVVVVGYRLSEHGLALLVCLGLLIASVVLGVPFARRLFRAGSKAPWLLVAPVALALVTATEPPLPLVFLALAQAVLLGLLVLRHEATTELLRTFFDHPSRLVVVSFLSLVALGSLLLTFPAASADGRSIAPLDAVFTATSATCVTGLIVLDTPNAFSPFGHGVVLALIQAGGLGIMVLSTFATLLLGGTLGLRGEKVLSEMLDLSSAHSAYRLTRFIVLSTLAVEAVGASFLTVFFRAEGLPWPDAVWKGVFHAVSAFCNAGFALQTDSLILFRDDPGALLVVAALITAGGLGFVVLAGLWRRLFERDGGQLNTQTRAVLAISAVLVVAGTLLFLGLEWNRSLGSLSVVNKLANALFQSVTLRTAGFNSVELGGLAAATVLFMMLFMFVGGSPGSTAGGIKTTTALVLLAAIRAAAPGDRPVRLFDREVPQDVIRRSLAILVISGLLVAVGFFLLLVFERQPFLALFFETVSAFGTVGLSLGATESLGSAGKLVVIVVMFIGRIGPLTLTLFLGTGGRTEPRFRLPYTRLMVG